MELLVVVMIITILATIVGVSVAKKPGEARIAVAKAQIGTFRTALQMYRMDNGRLPTQEQGLKALCEKPGVAPIPAKFPSEGYLTNRKLPQDPWGHDYVYLIPGPTGEPYELISYGSDGREGGQDEDADISSASL